MREVRNLRRRVVSHVFLVLCLGCVITVLFPLASILYSAAVNGGSVLSIHFLVSPAPPPCSTPPPGGACQLGGIGPALQGTLILVALASSISMPIGILTGIFVSEYGSRGFGRGVSFLTDVMTGTPSIVVGLFVYALFLNYGRFVGQTSPFSALAGAVALAVIMIPVVARTCEDALRAVPLSVREAALALGIPKYRTTLQVVLLSGLPAVLTGALLAVMRAGGEAAPLLLTAFGSPYGFSGLTTPIAAIPPVIFDQGTSGFANWVAGAWGAALVLILIMLTISISARLVLQHRFRVLSGA